MVYTYRPRGVCSQLMKVELEEGKIKDVQITGGCSGNLQGITALVRGMPAEQAIEKLQGIRCGMRSTSCPDQLSRALQEALRQEAGA